MSPEFDYPSKMWIDSNLNNSCWENTSLIGRCWIQNCKFRILKINIFSVKNAMQFYNLIHYNFLLWISHIFTKNTAYFIGFQNLTNTYTKDYIYLINNISIAVNNNYFDCTIKYIARVVEFGNVWFFSWISIKLLIRIIKMKSIKSVRKYWQFNHMINCMLLLVIMMMNGINFIVIGDERLRFVSVWDD